MTETPVNPFADASSLLDLAAQRVGDLAVTKGKDFSTHDLIEMRAILDAALSAYDPIVRNAPAEMHSLTSTDAQEAETPSTPESVAVADADLREVEEPKAPVTQASETLLSPNAGVEAGTHAMPTEGGVTYLAAVGNDDTPEAA